MQVRLDVPEEVAKQFAAEPGAISRAALEALAIEGARSSKLSVHQARQMLGIASRYDMDGSLKTHGVFLPVTLEEVLTDTDTAIASVK